MSINSSLPHLVLVVTTSVGWLLSGCAGRGLAPLAIHDDAHTSAWTVSFARATPRAASAGAEGRIRLWRLPGADAADTWQAHDGPVTALAFTDNDSVLISASEDASLARWTPAGELLQRVVTPVPITAMLIDTASDILVSGHANGELRVWRLGDFTLLQTRTLLTGTIEALAYHAGTRQLAASGADARVLMGSLSEPLRELPRAPSTTYSLAFSPDGSVLMGSGWYRLYRWTLGGNPDLQVLATAHRGLIRAIEYSPDGRQLASISRLTDSEVLLLDPGTGATLRRLQPHELCGRDVAFSPDGRFLASSSDDASVRFWDLSALPAKQ